MAQDAARTFARTCPGRRSRSRHGLRAGALSSFLIVASMAFSVAGGAGASECRIAPEPIRADEDYSCLRGAEHAGAAAYKFIPLAPAQDLWLSLGGEARLRHEDASVADFGLASPQGDSYLLTRLLAHADFHWRGKARLFVQAGHHEAAGARAPAPIDENALDIANAFVDLTPAKGVRLRAGRQELRFNPLQRFIALREGPNVRQSFDGLRLTTTQGAWRIDAFAVSPLDLSGDALADKADDDVLFSGVYASRAMARGAEADLFAFQLTSRRATFGAVEGEEERYSLGAAWRAEHGGFDIDAEGMIQLGRFAGQDIRAWGFGLDAGRAFDTRFGRTRIGIRLDAGSGDSDANDGRLETFNPLFPRGSYFSDAGLTSFANLVSLGPSLDVALTPALTLQLRYQIRRRHSAADALYVQPFSPLPGGENARGRDVGALAFAGAELTLTPSVRLQGSYQRHDVSADFRKVGARPVDFTMASIQHRF